MKTKTTFLAVTMCSLTVASNLAQPVIVTQPQWQTNAVASTAMFSVVATGAPALFYQWRFNSVDRAGATNDILVLTNVQTANQGTYAAVVTNVEGAVTSAVARLYVIPPPRIIQQPTNQSASLGASVTFTAVAASSPLSTTNYQWRLNEVGLLGRTNAALTLSNVQSSDAGAYSVVITNLSGAVTSQVATLIVDATFTKITVGSIVTDPGNYWTGSWGDYDNDGYLDVFVGSWFYDNTNHLYHNNGDGTFSRVAATDIVKIPSNQHGSSWGDYDNDGYLDLIVTAGNPQITHNVIYRNNGNGTFTGITNGPIYEETTDYGIGFHSPSWVDYDNDGFLDLFISGHTPQNHLWRNNGDGSFTKITKSAVVLDFVEESEGRTWVDYDNDGYIDLFVCNLAPGKNLLYRNNGDATFTKVTNSVLTSMADDSLGCAWGDYNNDGFLDVFLANGYVTHGKNSLYKNNGDGTFTRITEGDIVNDQLSGGYCAHCVWGDYDNDGYLDLFVATGHYSISLAPCYLYHNNGDGTFTRIMEGSPVNDLGVGHCPIWVDYDSDGFLDLFESNGAHWAEDHGAEALLTNFLYRNNGNSNHWITIKLIGTVSNRSAIGAKVRVKATMRGQTTWQVRQIFGGESDSSEQPLDAHFGLGDATNVDLVRIEWPSGTVQELTNVAVKQFLTVTEPPHLRPPRISNGMFAFTLKGGRGFQYGIQRSTNAQSWMPGGSVTVTNFSGIAEFIEPVDSNASSRFYRAVSP